jgi:hypothetical protein
VFVGLGWESLPGTKHSNLLLKFVNYRCEKIYNTGPWSIFIHSKNLMGLTFMAFLNVDLRKWLTSSGNGRFCLPSSYSSFSGTKNCSVGQDLVQAVSFDLIPDYITITVIDA